MLLNFNIAGLVPMDYDNVFMKEAISLARKTMGKTSPNPMVGAVLVKNGKIIGKGFHERYGDKHAEIFAIDNATESVKGATLYCNLEPCCHESVQKHNPPCVQRIIKEKIKKVVIATIDPNPYVSGRGIELLRKAGVIVDIGINKKEAILLNETYFKSVQRKEPFIHIKIAQSLDGRIATKTGESKWITNRYARLVVQRMRKLYDGILVGCNTVKTDNPRLTIREKFAEQPFRIILDSDLCLSENINVVSYLNKNRSIVVTSDNQCSEKIKRIEDKGFRVIKVSKECNGLLNLNEVITKLFDLGINSILVEGGSKIFTQFISRMLFDKISIFVAPIIIGEGKNSINDLNILRISKVIRFKNSSFETIGDNLLFSGYRDLRYTFGKLAEDLICLQG